MSGTYIIHAPDDADVASKVAAQLKQSGIDVINGITETECEAVTLVFSPAADESPQVREETAYAIWTRLPITVLFVEPASVVDYLFLLNSYELVLNQDLQSPTSPMPSPKPISPLGEENIEDMFFTAVELIEENPGQAIYLLNHIAHIQPNFADGQIESFSRHILNDNRERWLEALLERGGNAIGSRDWAKADRIIADIRALDPTGDRTENLEVRLRSVQLSQLLSQANIAIEEDNRDAAHRIAEMMLAIDDTDTYAQEILATVKRRNESDTLYRLAALAHSQGRDKAALLLVHQVNKINPEYGDPSELVSNRAIGVNTGRLLKEIATLDSHEYAVNSLAFTPDGALMASGSRDNTIRLWEMPAGRQVAVLRRDDGAVRSIVFSPDGAYMASLSGSVIRVWTMPEGHEAVVFDATNRFDNVSAFAFSPKGDGLICGHVNGQMSWIKIADGKQIMFTRPHDRSVQATLISSSGKRLVSCAGNTAKVWSVLDGSLRLDHVFEEERLISAACFSPDETMLTIIVSFQARTRDMVEGKDVFFCDHDARTTLLSAIAFSQDNSILATGATDGITKLWAVPDGTLLNTLDGEHTVNALQFWPGGGLLAVATGRDIKLWGLPQKKTN